MKFKLAMITLIFFSPLDAAELTMYTLDSDFKEDSALIAQSSQLYLTTTGMPQNKRDELENNIQRICKIYKARYDLTYSPTSFMKRIYPKVEAICDKY